MTKLWNFAAACALAPSLVLAQESAAPAAGHSEHEQHAAQQEQAPPADRPSPMQGQMCSMHAEDGMMREHMRGLEGRLESIEQLLQQMLERQRAGDSQAAEPRRDRRR